MCSATRSSSASEVIISHLRYAPPAMTPLAELSRVYAALILGRSPVDEGPRERNELVHIFEG